jgi:GNAT superfamily N-acetyltransferase
LEIARLFLMASEGLAEYIWSRMAEPGESLLEAGARRCSGEGIACSYENCFIAEIANTTVGMLNAFPMEERDRPDDVSADPALRPFVELRDYGSLFVSGVAVYPQHRGRAIGTRLLAIAEQQAVSYGLTRLSLICLEQNQGAMRLYARLGFQEIDRQALIAHPVCWSYQGDVVLLTKPADLDRRPGD